VIYVADRLAQPPIKGISGEVKTGSPPEKAATKGDTERAGFVTTEFALAARV
jgi:hypothetical protein